MNNDTPDQPMTLEAWIARKRQELAEMRAEAHRELDALFDRCEAERVADVEQLRRDVNGARQH